jgi:hypothetical protein
MKVNVETLHVMSLRMMRKLDNAKPQASAWGDKNEKHKLGFSPEVY